MKQTTRIHTSSRQKGRKPAFRRWLSVINVLMVCCLLVQCANRLSLEGGPRDSRPPDLTDESDANFQKNFQDDEFVLVFDEFVKVEKANEQVVVSPPLKYSLQPVVRGKKIMFRFDEREVLLDSTTYLVQFGEAIQDITEGNPVKNLRYVFSTGNVIDSMFVRVHATDMLTGAPVPNALVMLYPTMSDTVIRSGRPLYFSRADSSGFATVENIRSGNYRLIAMVDANRNYLLDLPEEMIGSVDTLIPAANLDTMVYHIQMYREIEPPLLLDHRRLDSLLFAITISGEINYLRWQTDNGQPIETFIDGDSLFLYNTNQAEQIILYSDYHDTRDTVHLDEEEIEASGSRFHHLSITGQQSKQSGQVMTLKSVWNAPITDVNPDLIGAFALDSPHTYQRLPSLSFVSDSLTPHVVTFVWNHKDLQDTIVFEAGAVSSWQGRCDTILRRLQPLKAESLSNLNVVIEDLDSTRQYIVRLIDNDEVPVDRIIIQNQDSLMWQIPNLFPAKHRLEIITDENRNGHRDGAWFDKRQYPEPYNAVEINNLRADWDVETSIRPKR